MEGRTPAATRALDRVERRQQPPGVVAISMAAPFEAPGAEVAEARRNYWRFEHRLEESQKQLFA